MSHLIPKSFVDDLLLKVDITEVIGARVKLKRTGSNFLGLCPFHSEKTPSFSVSQPKQFYHCFGCHASGNAITFLMQFEKLDFVDAVESLAASFGMVVPRSEHRDGNDNYRGFCEITEQVTQLFEGELKKSSKAIGYLKSRGLSGVICKTFRIGYAPANWDNLRSLYSNSEFKKQKMLTLGIIATKDRSIYAKFRDRVVFPIRNAKGHIVGFGARTIGNDVAKYLNSQESSIFHKGNELYGLYEAKKASRMMSQLIVVEGYLDVVSLAQFGITNVVATLGTAISSQQIQLLLRHTSSIVFCFDGDKAGRAAAWRALEVSLSYVRDGIHINFLFLPEDLDPDALIRSRSREQFNHLLKTTSISLEEFFIKQLRSMIDSDTIHGKAALVQRANTMIQKMPRGIFYQLLLSKVAMVAGINKEEMLLFGEQLPKAKEISSGEARTSESLPLPMQKIVSILLHYPYVISEIDNINDLESIEIVGVDLVKELLEILKNNPKATTGAILEHWRGKEGENILLDLVSRVPIIPQNLLKNELLGLIQTLRNIVNEREVDKLLATVTRNHEDNDGRRKKLQDLIVILKQKQ